MTVAMYLMLLLAAASLLAPVWSWTAKSLGGREQPWNVTGVALGLAYFAGQAIYLDDPSRSLRDMIDELFMIDVATVGVIFCKAIGRCPDQDFRNGWEHLRCFLDAPPLGDWIILGCFPLMWFAYVAEMGDFGRWWFLFWIAMAQFLIAGFDAFHEWRRDMRVEANDPGIPPSGLQFAWAGSRRWST